MPEGEETIIREKIIDGQIGAKPVFTVNHHEFRVRRGCDVFQQFPRGDAFPEIIEFAPPRDAVHIREDLDSG
jgi:hypothetical protein